MLDWLTGSILLRKYTEDKTQQDIEMRRDRSLESACKEITALVLSFKQNVEEKFKMSQDPGQQTRYAAQLRICETLLENLVCDELPLKKLETLKQQLSNLAPLEQSLLEETEPSWFFFNRSPGKDFIDALNQKLTVVEINKTINLTA